jgi:hypothetical protein
MHTGLSINLANGNITNATTITATTFTGALSGNASSATKVNLSKSADGSNYYLVMSLTPSGVSDLLTDTAGASYNSSTNTADINITANAGSATKVRVNDDPTNTNEQYLVFASGTTTENKDLRMDASTTALSYVPNTGTLTATAFNSVSDYRIKTNVQPITSTNYQVDALNPVCYYNTASNKTDLGFIAHEVQEHFPMLVSGVKDGPSNQSINYSGLIPILVSEIKELKMQMQQMKQELQEIKRSHV